VFTFFAQAVSGINMGRNVNECVSADKCINVAAVTEMTLCKAQDERDKHGYATDGCE